MVFLFRFYLSVYLEFLVNRGLEFRAPGKIYPAKIYQILTEASWVNLEQVSCCALLQKTAGRGPKNLGGRSAYSGQKSDIPRFLLFPITHMFRIFHF